MSGSIHIHRICDHLKIWYVVRAIHESLYSLSLATSFPFHVKIIPTVGFQYKPEFRHFPNTCDQINDISCILSNVDIYFHFPVGFTPLHNTDIYLQPKLRLSGKNFSCSSLYRVAFLRTLMFI